MEAIEPVDLGTGHDVDIVQTHLELYRLIATFLSDDNVVKVVASDIRHGKVGHPRYHFLPGLRESFFRSEISRILTYTTIQCRMIAGTEYQQQNPEWSKTCGTLETTAKKGAPLEQGPTRCGQRIDRVTGAL